MLNRKRIRRIGQLKHLLFVPFVGMLLIFCSVNARAFIPEPTVNPVSEGDSTIFLTVQEMPKFPGGDSALVKFIRVNLKYPDVAKENKIEGRVYVEFVIDEKGVVTDVEVKRSPDPSLSEEAVRLITSLPKWIPGKQKGKAVKVRYTVPIAFKLPQKEEVAPAKETISE